MFLRSLLCLSISPSCCMTFNSILLILSQYLCLSNPLCREGAPRVANLDSIFIDNISSCLPLFSFHLNFTLSHHFQLFIDERVTHRANDIATRLNKDFSIVSPEWKTWINKTAQYNATCKWKTIILCILLS